MIDQIDLEHLLGRFDQAEPLPMPKFEKKLDKFPSLNTNSNVLAFVKLVGNEICKIKINQSDHDNLSVEERSALKLLKEHPGITIKPSDKGGNIVIMDNKKYIDMCMKILENKKWYCKMNANRIAKFSQEFYSLVDSDFEQNIITKPEWEFIRTKQPKIPTFYALPKLHKCINVPLVDPLYLGMGH